MGRRIVALCCLTLGLSLLVADVHADRNYTVRNGDTLARIARRFRVSITDIRRANRLRGDNVRVGRKLRIPTHDNARSARRAGAHLVRAGDSLSSIAKRYRVPVNALKRLNRLRNDNIRVGQSLRIPGRRRENHMPRVQARELRPDQQEAAARAESLQIGSTRAGQTSLAREIDPRWIEAAGQAPQAIPEYAYGKGTAIVEGQTVESQPIVDEPGTLQLPIDTAYFMRGWGSGAGGYHLAVDIGSPMNTPIRASERGIVVYAGSGIHGYGRFVVIVHPNGYATAYAHNNEILVVAGELVARGQIISLLGNTGISRGPHLHYMLMKDGEHCDPLPLLRPRIQSRSGTEIDTNVTTWADGEHPEEVRCLDRDARRHPGVRRRRSRSRMSSRMRARMR